MEHLLSSEGLISLLTLTFLEIVLGIDNVIFISLVTSRLPAARQQSARVTGLSLALGVRILLLLIVSWIIGLTKPVFTVFDFPVSFRDIILIVGGLFLIGKSVSEIHSKMQGTEEGKSNVRVLTFRKALIQILLLDIVFSLDSIITAVGLVDHISIIIIAIVISMAVMLIFSKRISEFIHQHPSMKLLAISFLLMIGTLLVVEGLHVHVPKGYIYFAMFFAVGVEVLNMRIRKKTTKVGKPDAFNKAIERKLT
jgi:predicted tellurium resistance membrane protein TerC